MVAGTEISVNSVMNILRGIPDPEIPVMNIVEMGIVREVKIQEDKIVVAITPTYSGCPAMKMIEDEIAVALKENNILNFKIATVLSPAWTTDWMSEEAKEKLRQYGIAPPLRSGEKKEIVCPRCGSSAINKVSEFGSTPCKALYTCKKCLEPFDYFKCI